MNGSFLPAEYLADLRTQFEKLKAQADKAVAQVGDEQWQTPLDPESNSLAVIMRHMAGNLRSRFTDFLITDGEKPDRDRDGEFEPAPLTRQQILEEWERGWRVLFASLDTLRPDDLLRRVTIRGEAMPALTALQRALTHQASHVGQLVLLAKHFAGPQWQTLSVPRRPRTPRGQ